MDNYANDSLARNSNNFSCSLYLIEKITPQTLHFIAIWDINKSCIHQSITFNTLDYIYMYISHLCIYVYVYMYNYVYLCISHLYIIQNMIHDINMFIYHISM